MHLTLMSAALTPPVLHREDEEEHIAILEAIGNTLELRFYFCSVCKAPISIEVIVIVQTRAVIMVTIRRNKRHLIQNRTHGSFKPAFPLPFRVSLTTRIYKVTREEAELRIRFMLRYSLSTFSCLLNIYRILNMAIRHVNEREIALVLILRYKLSNFTPVTVEADTPAISRSRCQFGCSSLMAYIIKLRVARQTRCGTNIILRTFACLNRCIVEICITCGSTNSYYTINGSKVFCRSIGQRKELYNTIRNATIREPAETHMGVRITVNRSNLVIWLIFRLQFINHHVHCIQFCIQMSQFRIILGLQTINTCLLFCYKETNETWNRIILDVIVSISI